MCFRTATLWRGGFGEDGVLREKMQTNENFEKEYCTKGREGKCCNHVMRNGDKMTSLSSHRSGVASHRTLPATGAFHCMVPHH